MKQQAEHVKTGKKIHSTKTQAGCEDPPKLDVAGWISIDAAKQLIGYQPTTNIEQGLANFVDWYRNYYP